MCGRHTKGGKKKKKKKGSKDTDKQWTELLIRFTYLKVPDPDTAVYFKALFVQGCVFGQEASCQGEIMDF